MKHFVHDIERHLVTEVASFEGAMNLISPYPKVVGHSFNEDGSHYGSFGAVFATEVEPNKQIEDKRKLLPQRKDDDASI